MDIDHEISRSAGDEVARSRSEARLDARRPDAFLLFCVSACAILLACASPPPRAHGWTLSKVGLLPVEVTRTVTFYEAGFKEGFERLYFNPVEMGTSNSPGDIILMAIWLLSIPVGLVSGVVEEGRGPSPEEMERIRAVVDPVLPEFDLARVVRGEIAGELLDLVNATSREAIGRARSKVERVVGVSSLEQARKEDLTMLLEVRIERIVVNSPWEENPMGQIRLETVVRVIGPQTGVEIAQYALSNPRAGSPLDWSLLEAGEVGPFAQRLTEAFEIAGTSLAEAIVEEVWGRKKTGRGMDEGEQLLPIVRLETRSTSGRALPRTSWRGYAPVPKRERRTPSRSSLVPAP